MNIATVHQLPSVALQEFSKHVPRHLTMDYNSTLALYRNVCDTDKLGYQPSGIFYFRSVNDIRQPQLFNKYFVPIVATYSITFLFGVVGNVVSIVAMSSSRAARNATNVFLVSLAIADLLMLVVHLPLEVVEYFLLTWDKGGTVCKLKAYVYFLSGMSSVLNLTAVSVERYIVIVYPMKSRSLCTTRNCRKVLLVVWILAIILTAPVLITTRAHPFTFVNNSTCVTAYYCWDHDEGEMLAFSVATYQVIFMFCVPLILMAFCYTRVIKVLWISARQMTAITPNSNRDEIGNCDGDDHSQDVANVDDDRNNSMRQDTLNDSDQAENSIRRTSLCVSTSKQDYPLSVSTNLLHVNGNVIKARQQVIRMLLLVIVLFMGCWGPRLVLNAIIKYGLRDYNKTVYEARVVCYLLSFVHSCLNPIIYSLMSSNVRQMMLRSLENSCTSTKTDWCSCVTNICNHRPQPTEYKEYFRHRASSSEMICYSTRTTHLSSISTLAEYRTSVGMVDSDLSNYLGVNDRHSSLSSTSHSHRLSSLSSNHSHRMSSLSGHSPISCDPSVRSSQRFSFHSGK